MMQWVYLLGNKPGDSGAASLYMYIGNKGSAFFDLYMTITSVITYTYIHCMPIIGNKWSRTILLEQFQRQIDVYKALKFVKKSTSNKQR